MKICTLASSSRGNSTLVFTDNTKILIDAGISYADLQAKLLTLNISCDELSAILITHEHSDHIKGVQTLLKRHKIPAYVHVNGSNKFIQKITGISDDQIVRFFDDSFNIGEFKIMPFQLSHDSSCCVGYSISEGENKMTIATDLGVFPPELIHNFTDSKLVILESNYDIDMLMENPKYSFLLKNRILGSRGHLGNTMAARVVEKLAHMGVKQVVLAHLSPENNTPEICFNTICTYLASVGVEVGKNIMVDVARQDGISAVYNLK